ncbi:hypothetical protein CFP56_037118 [Quercus suber]|uniref:Uncharacterized protein n=1 Tax=Quercus suber TaxID=58331 RepID=A0AAW0LNC8_QUESU
MSTNTRHRK